MNSIRSIDKYYVATVCLHTYMVEFVFEDGLDAWKLEG